MKRFHWWFFLRMFAPTYRSGDEAINILARQRGISRTVAGVEAGVDHVQEADVTKNTITRLIALDKEIGGLKATRYLRSRQGQTELKMVLDGLSEQFPTMPSSVHGVFTLMQEYLHDVDAFEVPYLLEVIYGRQHYQLIPLILGIQEVLLSRPIDQWWSISMASLEALCNRLGVIMNEPSVQKPLLIPVEVAEYIVRAGVRKQETSRTRLSLDGADTTNRWFFQTYRWLEATKY